MRFTIRGLLAYTALAGALVWATIGPGPESLVPFAVVCMAVIALWPWLFGHGGGRS